MLWQIIIGLALTAEILAGQTVHLKTRVFEGSDVRTGVHRGLAKRWRMGRTHYMLQFKTPINDDIREQLMLRGAVITGTVPDDAVIVAVGDDFTPEGLDTVFAEEMNAEDKISPILGTHGNDSAFVVEFHSDVDPEAARALLQSEGVTIVEHPDLNPAHLLILGTVDDAQRLKLWDEVAYLFPAPAEMVQGERFQTCTGALSSGMAVSQYVRMGHGWSPDSSGKVNLGYFFGELTGKVPDATVRGEVVRAMAEWSKVARVQFLAAGSPTAQRTIAVKFAIRDHGDGYPFDGPSGVLAHTFYPANPEPIAGDMHMDAEEGWHAGVNIDVYTVALHELGHALGLGHSDQPGAIMYPYYRFPAQIGIDDIAGIQSIYGAPTPTVTVSTVPPTGSPIVPPTVPTPVPTAPVFTISVLTPTTGAMPVNTAAVDMSGIVANNSGAVTVNWQTDRGTSGRASVTASTWTAAKVAVFPGSTTITVTATDAQHRTATKVLVMVRPAAAVQDLIAPTLSVQTPIGTAVQTALASISVSGIASDNVDVARVTWQNGALGSGTAIGTKTWSVGSIPLLVGTNMLIFRAYDTAGNTSWRSVVVTRR